MFEKLQKIFGMDAETENRQLVKALGLDPARYDHAVYVRYLNGERGFEPVSIQKMAKTMSRYPEFSPLLKWAATYDGVFCLSAIDKIGKNDRRTSNDVRKGYQDMKQDLILPHVTALGRAVKQPGGFTFEADIEMKPSKNFFGETSVEIFGALVLKHGGGAYQFDIG